MVLSEKNRWPSFWELKAASWVCNLSCVSTGWCTRSCSTLVRCLVRGLDIPLDEPLSTKNRLLLRAQVWTLELPDDVNGEDSQVPHPDAYVLNKAELGDDKDY